MYHAEYWGLPRARLTTWLLILFFIVSMSDTHRDYLARDSSESSQMVPNPMKSIFPQALDLQRETCRIAL